MLCNPELISCAGSLVKGQSGSQTKAPDIKLFNLLRQVKSNDKGFGPFGPQPLSSLLIHTCCIDTSEGVSHLNLISWMECERRIVPEDTYSHLWL